MFPTEEDVFKAVLDCKRYGKTRNLIGYFTLENGQKIMTSAWQNDNYHGFQSFAEGEITPQEAHEIGVETARGIERGGC